jgi:hypothetical protein
VVDNHGAALRGLGCRSAATTQRRRAVFHAPMGKAAENRSV